MEIQRSNDIGKNRIVFAPYQAKTDTDPTTGKVGVRVHGTVAGFFLSLFGKAEKIDCTQGALKRSVYVNIGSCENFFKRHNINTPPDPYSNPGFHPFTPKFNLLLVLNNAIKLEKLSNQIQEGKADYSTYMKRGEEYFYGKHFDKAISDFQEAIKCGANDEKKADAEIAIIHCYCETRNKEIGLPLAEDLQKRFPNLRSSIDSSYTIESFVTLFRL